jgi:hypothetical protein
MRDWHDVFCRRQRPWYDFLSLLIMILHLLGHLSQIYFMILAIQTKLVDWRSTLGWGAETTAKGASSSLPLPPSSPAPYSLTSAYDGGVSLPYRTIPDRLFEERIIMLVGTVDEAMAVDVTMRLLLMEVVNPTKPIYLYINSAGGSVSEGLAIYDTMQFVQPRIHTVGIGKCFSMGAVLLAAGAPGHRVVLPNTKVMVRRS